MSTVSTWTGWEANALRKALRMSVTEFAAHVGVARRTAAKWSSQGRGVVLRAEMQAALDTVLARSATEVSERFAHLRTADHLADGHRSPLGQGDGQTVPTAAARLLDVLFDDGDDLPTSGPSWRTRLYARVGRAKSKYQACRYAGAVDELVDILPFVNGAGFSPSGDERAALHALAADAHHVAASILLKLGQPTVAPVAAERSSRCGAESGDPVTVGASARIVTHALMGVGHPRRALTVARAAAEALERHTRLSSADSRAVYGALLLRGAVAAARTEDRDTTDTMLAEAARVADRHGHDGNDRWTGFGPTNVLQHRAHLALALGDAGTSIAYARRVQPDTILYPERKAALFVDMARAYTQWGRHDQALSSLRHADRVAPEEIRSRPVVHHLVRDLAALSRGHLQGDVTTFAASTSITV